MVSVIGPNVGVPKRPAIDGAEREAEWIRIADLKPDANAGAAKPRSRIWTKHTQFGGLPGRLFKVRWPNDLLEVAEATPVVSLCLSKDRSSRSDRSTVNEPNVGNDPNDPNVSNDPNDWIHLNRFPEFNFGIFLERVAHHPVRLEDKYVALLTIERLHHA